LTFRGGQLAQYAVRHALKCIHLLRDIAMTRNKDQLSDEEALRFHSEGKPGKIAIEATKPMATQRDLSLAYSPGVAAPVRAIAENPDCAFDYTSRGNMVAVISNGTAILGLGNLGPLASKPVMEGDRKSTRLNSSHDQISYAVFCLKKKKTTA